MRVYRGLKREANITVDVKVVKRVLLCRMGREKVVLNTTEVGGIFSANLISKVGTNVTVDVDVWIFDRLVKVFQRIR